MRAIVLACLLVACAVSTTATVAQDARKIVRVLKKYDCAVTLVQRYEFAGKDLILIGRDATNHIKLPSR